MEAPPSTLSNLSKIKDGTKKKIIKAMTCSTNRTKPIKLLTSHSSPNCVPSDYVSSSVACCFKITLGVLFKQDHLTLFLIIAILKNRQKPGASLVSKYLKRKIYAVEPRVGLALNMEFLE